MLTKSSLSEMRRRISVDVLPKTIQDAIHITRRLGVPHLWVDALCIIQDSKKDKSAEIKKMSTIYMNTAVTIAATSAETVHNGFLSIARPQESSTFPFLHPDGHMGQISLSISKWEAYP
jgi:Heterokaryon incompatibility protein (HET)